MTQSFNRDALAEHDRASEAEARRLERTRPKHPAESKRFKRWGRSNPLNEKETAEGHLDRYMASLSRGDRIICNVICAPKARAAAKGRKPYHATRVVDRRIWAKLDGPARTRYIEAVRAELGA